MMKIVILDGYTENPGDLSWKGLEAFGEVTVYDRTTGDEGEIIRRIGGAECVYTNKVPLSEAVFQRCPAIRYVGVLATGYNVVDVKAARARGVTVCNIPNYGTAAVGQFTIAMLLELCNHVGHHNQAVHDGRWTSCPDWCFWDYPLIELDQKVMGIIGYGRIGQSTGRIAQALGMKVLAYAAHRVPELESETCRYADLETLLRESDVISLHCPLFPETEGIINKENIGKMKDGVMILNTSRGPLVVDADLAEALESGKVRGAGLDVVSEEPIREDNPLLAAPNCLITPHIAWAPRESRQRLMDIGVENLRRYLAGEPVNVVN